MAGSLPVTIHFREIHRPTSFLDDLADYLDSLDSVDFNNREIHCSIKDQFFNEINRMPEVEEIYFF